MPNPLVVLHSHPDWLAQTMTWLYNEVHDLPGEIESHIVCRQTRNLEQFHVPNIHSLESLPVWRRRLDRTLQRLHVRRHLGLLTEVARQTRARVLHSHFGNVGYADRGAARARRLRHVVSFYGRDVSQLPRKRPLWCKRYRALFASADRILSMGDHMTRCLLELGCPPEKLTVHHLGVHVEEFRFVPRNWQPDPGRPLRVLMAAMFREKKGLHYGITALGIAAGRGVPLEATVIGAATAGDDDQEEKRRIERAVEASGLGKKIRFPGVRPYAELMRQAYAHDLFMSPSVTAADGDTEGGVALPVIEMSATGMPVVATRHADTPGVITHGESGLLAEERDAGGLADQIVRLYEHPEEWRPMVLAARRHVEAEFNALEQGRRLAAIYRAVAES